MRPFLSTSIVESFKNPILARTPAVTISNSQGISSPLLKVDF